MNAKALGGAAAAAVVGALVWGMISWITGLEIGYLAWAVGGLVGFAAVALGGSGTSLAATCAALSLVAMLGGRFLAAELALPAAFAASADLAFSRESYEAVKKSAADFAALRSESQHAEFMVAHGYAPPGEVDGASLSLFREQAVPYLVKFQAEQPSFESWSEAGRQKLETLSASEDFAVQAVMESFSPIDLIFALLGVTTAFRIVQRGPGQVPAGVANARSK